MPYYDGTCDECGTEADQITPMYCLCNACFDGDCEEDDDKWYEDSDMESR